MKVCVIGAGHVGLVTGACLAHLGNDVICVDNDLAKTSALLAGEMPIYEPGLAELVKEGRDSGRLKFTGDIADGVGRGDVIFIAVGTPTRASGEADVTGVEAVSRAIAREMQGYRVIVEKSTVPVRTGEWVKKTIASHAKEGTSFDVVSNPEFLREGQAVEDFMRPDRVVIGVESERAEKVMRELYAPLGAPILVTDIKSAELIKHASNCFLAMKISYINSVAAICERVGADVAKVSEGMGLDKRIGSSFLRAGIGYGGSCFPKDVAAFIGIARELGYDFELLLATERANQAQRHSVVRKLKEMLWVLKGKTIGVLGLTFKPDTDDIRDSPSLDIISVLLAEGARIQAYDPKGREAAQKLLPDVTYCQDAYAAAEGADALVLATEWDEFRHLDFDRLKRSMRGKVFIDGRNMYEPSVLHNLGFQYRGVGR